MKLTLGEYATPHLEASEARSIFLAVIEEVAPEVLEALRNDVYPRYIELGPLFSPRDLNEVPGELREALEKWASQFSISAEWVLEQALATLDLWRQYPDMLEWEPLEWGCIDVGEGFWTPKPPDPIGTFKFAWDPAAETRARARERIQKAFAEALEEYLNRIEAFFEAHPDGWRRAIEKRARDQDQTRHFRWLAYYLVKGWSYAEIARAENPGADEDYEAVLESKVIQKAVRDTAELIGIELPDRRGRPRAVRE